MYVYPFRSDIYAELVQAAIHGKTVSYLDLPGKGGSRFNVGGYLARIGREEARQGRPQITAVVVQKNTGKPSRGFADLMDEVGLRRPGETDDEMWRRALADVYDYWHRDLARGGSGRRGVTTGAPGTKYIRMEVDVWYQEDDDSIHITSRDDPKLHSTVKNDSASARGHGSLFRHFQRILADHGRWPRAA